MLVPFGRGLWTDEGPVAPAQAGFVYPTRMAVAQLADGGLWVWSPVPLSDRLRRDIDRLGQVTALVSPNHLHDRWMSDWATAYPLADIHVSPGGLRKRPDLPPYTTELGPVPPPLWAGQIDQIPLPGNLYSAEVIFHHRLSGTILIADLVQQLPRGWFGGWRELFARADGVLADEPRVPWKFRLAFADRAAARRAVVDMLDWRAQSLLLAHGPLIPRGARAQMLRAFAWLLK